MLRSIFISFFWGIIIINLCVFLILNLEFKNKKLIAFLGCIVSLMMIISICFFPFPIQDDLLEEMIQNKQGLKNNFVPFRTIFTIVRKSMEYNLYGNIVYQIIGNIILFLPLGFCLYFFIDKKKRILRSVVCIIFTSFSVEALQGLFGIMMSINYRAVDVDDFILNVFGGGLGIILASYVYDCKDRLLVLIKRR